MSKEGKLYCELLQKKYSCWPTTEAGHYAVVPCPAAGGADTSTTFYTYNSLMVFSSFDRVLTLFYLTENASLYCTTNGTWHTRANYSSCFDIKPKQKLTLKSLSEIAIDHTSVKKDTDRNAEDYLLEVISNLGTILYDVGFGLSTVALVIALFIFLYFRTVSYDLKSSIVILIACSALKQTVGFK
ncbi:hypothetical protein KUTeg_008372 [Tegillarca granosa]|uniref:G-protein coupled receptors family 2 profile 1 domain-containing protein n=1 Tax=Tegillarca granosa TaxID=220873 RepID=A0ABQ9FC69_TEGGR|nr:hypothetical protein KUTeg_008372 [Tegillarca granosa]